MRGSAARNSTARSTHLEDLPTELLRQIILSASFASDGFSLASASSSLHGIKQAIEPHTLWRCFCVNRFDLLRQVVASLGGWPENAVTKSVTRLQDIYSQHECLLDSGFPDTDAKSLTPWHELEQHDLDYDDDIDGHVLAAADAIVTLELRTEHPSLVGELIGSWSGPLPEFTAPSVGAAPGPAAQEGASDHEAERRQWVDARLGEMDEAQLLEALVQLSPEYVATSAGEPPSRDALAERLRVLLARNRPYANSPITLSVRNSTKWPGPLDGEGGSAFQQAPPSWQQMRLHLYATSRRTFRTVRLMNEGNEDHSNFPYERSFERWTLASAPFSSMAQAWRLTMQRRPFDKETFALAFDELRVEVEEEQTLRQDIGLFVDLDSSSLDDELVSASASLRDKWDGRLDVRLQRFVEDDAGDSLSINPDDVLPMEFAAIIQRMMNRDGGDQDDEYEDSEEDSEGGGELLAWPGEQVHEQIEAQYGY